MYKCSMPVRSHIANETYTYTVFIKLLKISNSEIHTHSLAPLKEVAVFSNRAPGYQAKTFQYFIEYLLCFKQEEKTF